jgi:CubicO group peptidase (beta-lactamase class C family)
VTDRKSQLAASILWTGLVSGLLGSGLASQNQATPERFREVAEFVESAVSTGRAPSVALAAILDGELVWTRGFGSIDLEQGTKASAESLYLLASVSKPLTATGMMLLVDKGELDLDQAANSYLPKAKIRAYRGDADQVTLRRLANHSSGLPVHWSFFYAPARSPSREISIQRYAFTHYAPGSGLEYCNLAFGIIDYIVELRSGMPWRRFMEEQIYDPLGMSSTSDRIRPGFEGQASKQYLRDAGGRFRRVPRYGFDHDGASAIWSSAADLSRFLQFFLLPAEGGEKRLLSEPARLEMLAAKTAGNPYGVAWNRRPFQGHPAFSHTGSMPGVATQVIGFPEARAGIVVLINASANGLRNEISNRLVRALLPSVEAEAAAATEDAGSPDPEPISGRWQGRLAQFGGNLTVELEIEGQQARARIGESPRSFSRLRQTGDALVLSGGGRIRIPTQDEYQGLSNLELRLRREADGGLTGIAVLTAEGYYCLSHWLELKPAK